MVLRAVQNLSLPDQVFDQIASEIINGRYNVDDNLPAERKLVETFGVNRHVVREALKRLEQLGLIRISQGGGTKVLDFRRHAGLDVLTLMATRLVRAQSQPAEGRRRDARQ
jgi:GntR family transcriptional repressor for pyruvate dehydrogenase complex